MSFLNFQQMVLYHIKIYVFLLFVIISIPVTGQEEAFSIPDSLVDKSYDYLFNKYQENYRDTVLSKLYIKSHLKKATEANDKIEKSIALNKLSFFVKDSKHKLDLIKKALLEVKSEDPIHSIPPYNSLGIYYYENYQYDEALEQYIQVSKIAKENGDTDYEYIALGNIASIKGVIGKHTESLNLYRQCFNYENAKKEGEYSAIIPVTIFFAESLRNNNKNDSASYYYNFIIDKAYQEASFYGNLATINEGINLFFKKKYSSATILLNKGASNIDRSSIYGQKYYILSQLYLGKIQFELDKDSKKAKKYFLKVDSLLTGTHFTIPETREVYEFLMKDYKKQENFKAQLNIVDKLIKFDSITTLRKINTVDKLYSKFDTPQLLKSKEELIIVLKDKTNALNKRTNVLTTRTFYLILFILLLLIIFLIQYYRYSKQKKQFNHIINELNTKNTIDKKGNQRTSEIIPKKLTIDEDIIISVLDKLDHFEEKKEFLQQNINIPFLAKKCATNTKYISKIINTHKNKSFSNYINDLRIDFILKELKENKTLQRYTIKSISEEAGFNTAESFATAFKKRTGIKPSFFIKNLKN